MIPAQKNTQDGFKITNKQLPLKNWANFIKKTRQFFEVRQVLEVQTPIFQPHAISDVYIDSIVVSCNASIKKNPDTHYLQTSPELAMKSLIANGSGDIYQICQVFRDNEQGQYNQNEFTLLEWYRLDFDYHQLIDEVVDFLKISLPSIPVLRLSYEQSFSKFANIDILNQSINDLKRLLRQYQLCDEFEQIEQGQMLLFIHLIEPQLKQHSISVIYDYPRQQSCFAQIKNGVAKRFEVYVNGIEIANGYQELQSVHDYRQCFVDDKHKRTQLNKPPITINESFLTDITNGLPACSGVALGLGRLFCILALSKNP